MTQDQSGAIWFGSQLKDVDIDQIFNVHEWSYQVSYLRHRFLPSWPFWEPCSWYTHWCCYLDEEFWGKNLNAVFTLENENHNISALGECTTRIYQEYWGHYHHRGGASNAGSYLLIGKNLQPKRLPIFANSFIYTANDFGDQSILYNETKTSHIKKHSGTLNSMNRQLTFLKKCTHGPVHMAC